MGRWPQFPSLVLSIIDAKLNEPQSPDQADTATILKYHKSARHAIHTVFFIDPGTPGPRDPGHTSPYLSSGPAISLSLPSHTRFCSLIEVKETIIT